MGYRNIMHFKYCLLFVVYHTMTYGIGTLYSLSLQNAIAQGQAKSNNKRTADLCCDKWKVTAIKNQANWDVDITDSNQHTVLHNTFSNPDAVYYTGFYFGKNGSLPQLAMNGNTPNYATTAENNDTAGMGFQSNSTDQSSNSNNGDSSVGFQPNNWVKRTSFRNTYFSLNKGWVYSADSTGNARPNPVNGYGFSFGKQFLLNPFFAMFIETNDIFTDLRTQSIQAGLGIKLYLLPDDYAPYVDAGIGIGFMSYETPNSFWNSSTWIGSPVFTTGIGMAFLRRSDVYPYTGLKLLIYNNSIRATQNPTTMAWQVGLAL
jgi:hypothetical protein